MKRFVRVLPVFGAMLVIGAAACSDPTDATLGQPDIIRASFTVQNVKAGAKGSLTAALLDPQLNQLGVKVEATSSKPTLVKLDSVVFKPELNQTVISYTAGATTRVDTSLITMTAEGKTATTRVIVSP